MAAIEPGTKAPEFSLPTIAGGTLSLSELLTDGPAVLFFYKHECPVCQMAAPYLQKLKDAYGASLAVAAVAQDDPAEAAGFAHRHGLTFPVLVDYPAYAVSRQYGLTTVPTTFLVDRSGVVLQTVLAWNRTGLNGLSEQVASLTGRPYVPVSLQGDGAPDFRPG